MKLPNGSELSPLIVPVVVTPEFYIGLEYHDGTTFAHCRPFVRWTPSLARKVRTACDAVMAMHGGPIFAASHQPADGDHAKFAKFCRFVGFTFFRTVRGTDDADHAVFVRWR